MTTLWVIGPGASGRIEAGEGDVVHNLDAAIWYARHRSPRAIVLAGLQGSAAPFIHALREVVKCVGIAVWSTSFDLAEGEAVLRAGAQLYQPLEKVAILPRHRIEALILACALAASREGCP